MISKIFVTVDILLKRTKSPIAEIVLVQRKNDPFKGMWALPGGFVDEHEELETAARRELHEETGIEMGQLEQWITVGTPHRDPRGHTVSVIYYGTAGADVEPTAADDAADARWFACDSLPGLAFDHSTIIDRAVKSGLL